MDIIQPSMTPKRCFYNSIKDFFGIWYHMWCEKWAYIYIDFDVCVFQAQGFQEMQWESRGGELKLVEENGKIQLHFLH